MREPPAALAPPGAYRQFIVLPRRPNQTRTHAPGKTDKFRATSAPGRVVSAHDLYILDGHDSHRGGGAFGGAYGVGFVFTEADPSGSSTWTVACCRRSGLVPLAASLCGSVRRGRRGKADAESAYLRERTAALHGCKEQAYGRFHRRPLRCPDRHQRQRNAAADFSHLPQPGCKLFPPDPVQSLEQGWTEGPCAEWRGPADDDELIRRALWSQSTASAFGGHCQLCGPGPATWKPCSVAIRTPCGL